MAHTVEDLIRWRAQNLGLSDVQAVVAALSSEKLRDDQVPLKMVDAVRQFRKLRQQARVSRVQSVLGTVSFAGPNVPAPPRHVTGQATTDGIAIARENLHQELSGFGIYAKGIAAALEQLIDAKLGNPAPAPEPEPKSPFRWERNTCWVGPIMIGRLEVINAEFYAAFFGAGNAPERLPGQHPIAVAKQRVEDRYREWAQAALST